MTGARLIVADLFDRNANAYYELGIAHTLRLPTVVIVDRVESLAFDAAGERVIAVGDDGTKIGVGEAEAAKVKLREFVRTVLDDAYVVENLVTAAAVELKVDYLSETGDAIAKEVSALRESIEVLAARFDKGFTFQAEAVLNPVPDMQQQVLPHLKPFTRALFSAGHFGSTGFASGIFTAPNQQHAEKCRAHLPELVDAFRRVTGLDWDLTIAVKPPAIAH